MHWPSEDGGTPIEDYWQTLLDLKKEGKVRAVGVSNHNTEQLARAEKLGHVYTLQPSFSAIRRDDTAAELPWCPEHQTGVIVYTGPMPSGLLFGCFTPIRRRACRITTGVRAPTSSPADERLTCNLAFVEAMKLAASRRVTASAPGRLRKIPGASIPRAGFCSLDRHAARWIPPSRDDGEGMKSRPGTLGAAFLSVRGAVSQKRKRKRIVPPMASSALRKP